MPRRFYIPMRQSARASRANLRDRRTRYFIFGLVIIAAATTAVWYIGDIRFKPAVQPENMIAEREHRLLTSENSVSGNLPQTESRDTVSSEAQNRAAPGIVERQEPIRIQVLNGCGVKGLAKLISPALRAKGFDVRETRNAGSFRYARSQIFDRTGRLENAFTVADSLGIERSLAATQIARNLTDIDITLIVGADFEQLKFNNKK